MQSPAVTPSADGCEPALTAATIDAEYNAYDLRRLESYARNMVDHHVIADMLPKMARQFFAERLRIDGGISAVQCAVFIGVGLQYRTVDEIAAELDVPVNQLLALFNKLIRKLRCAASRAFPAFIFFFDVLKSAVWVIAARTCGR